MEIYLVRHTTPQIEAGVCYGQTDLDVADSFAQECEVLYEKLRHLTEAAVYSSPLKRCSQLAAAVTARLAFASAVHDHRLMELHFGEWELKRWDDIPRGLIDVWAQEHVMQAPPQGESYHALHLRARDFLEEVSANKHAAAVIFTHAGVIRALLAEVLNLPLMHAFKLQIGYGSVTKLIVDQHVTHVGYVNR